MIHLWRGYRTARYSLPSFLILSLPHPPPFPAALFLLHSTFFIVSIFFLPFLFSFSLFSLFLPLYPPLLGLFSFSFPSYSTVCYPFVLLRFFAALNLSILAFPHPLSLSLSLSLSLFTDTFFYFSFFFLNTLSTEISFVPLSFPKFSIVSIDRGETRSLVEIFPLTRADEDRPT